MSYYASGVLPWTVSEEDEERFRRILRRLLAFFLLFSLIFPWLPVPKPDRDQVAEVPPRLAKLLLEQKPVPPVVQPRAPELPIPQTVKPKVPVPEKTQIARPAPKPDATARTEAARKKASRSGLLALQDDLADLRDNAAPDKLRADLKPGPGIGRGVGAGVGMAGSGPPLGEGARALITSKATAGSGGIANSRFSYGTGGGGLAGRSTTKVNSSIGGGAGGGGGGGGGSGGTLSRGGSGRAARSIEDIQLVFDRNKSSIFALYNRALREDPTLAGKVVLKLTIQPNGDVTVVAIVSSELNAPELERKLAARIRQFDFGAKDVDTMVVTYPIDFLPS